MLTSALAVRAQRTSTRGGVWPEGLRYPEPGTHFFARAKYRAKNPTQNQNLKTYEKNNIPHVAQCYATDRDIFNRSGSRIKSHGCAADHSRSGSQHHGRLRLRAK